MSMVTDMFGMTDYGGSAAAANAARESSQLSYKISKEQLDFQKAQYDDWKAIYGPLQEDLGTYFKNLTGDAMAAKQITEVQRGSQAAQEQVDKALAQRGLTGSGMEASLLRQNAFDTEAAKANIRANADTMAAQQKAGFLGIGLGQGTQMLNTQANVANAAASNQMSYANSQLARSTSLSTASMNAMGDIFGSAVDYGVSKWG